MHDAINRSLDLDLPVDLESILYLGTRNFHFSGSRAGSHTWFA